MVFFAVITELGRPKIAASMLPGGTPLQVSHIAIGDGGGAPVTPIRERAALVNEVYRVAVNSVDRHPSDPERIVIEATIPVTAGGWIIREYGLFDADGDLVAYGNFPETYKPLLSEGIGRDLTFRPHIVVGSDAAVTLVVDPAVTMATKQFVADSIAAAFRADRPHRYYRSNN